MYVHTYIPNRSFGDFGAWCWGRSDGLKSRVCALLRRCWLLRSVSLLVAPNRVAAGCFDCFCANYENVDNRVVLPNPAETDSIIVVCRERRTPRVWICTMSKQISGQVIVDLSGTDSQGFKRHLPVQKSQVKSNSRYCRNLVHLLIVIKLECVDLVRWGQ